MTDNSHIFLYPIISKRTRQTFSFMEWCNMECEVELNVGKKHLCSGI